MKYLLFFFTLFSFAQQTQYVNFKTVIGEISINTKDKALSGNVKYDFEVLQPIDTIKIDAQNMTFTDIKINGNEIISINTNKQLQLIFPFQKGKNTLTFNYSTQPKQALYFVNSESKDDIEIWTQGQGRYTSNWFPSFDDVNEKVVFNLDITFDKNYTVISNGILKNKLKDENSFTWQYRMQNPMSSYLLALAIGKYEEKNLKSKSRIPLEYYIKNNDVSRFEPTYRYSKEIFDFLEKEIGVKYPWEIYRQAPARDFLYAGMENTTTTLFSTRYVVDSTGFEDRKYTNVNAHELAHHWFGNLITTESSTHHWLQEGFATYYALLAEKEIYGEDYFYSKLYETAQQLKFASRTDTIPVLNGKASSLTFYEKGAWALFVLHDALGDKIFKKVIKNYLKKYAFKTVNTENFFDEIRKLSNYDLKQYSKVWLETTAFNTQQANELLNKNKATQTRLEVDKYNKKTIADKEEFLSKILQSDVYFTVKKAIVNQLKTEKYESKKQLLTLALNTNSIQVRQEVAATLYKIPEDFRVQYEALLDDKSYQTQEIALFYLWNNFPSHRNEYLDKSKNWIGFNDYNLRTLWLSLALSTPNYAKEPQLLINELIEYSSPKYEATTRQNALEKLIDFRLTNDAVLTNLVNATTHHMWQFSKFARESIRTLLKNSEMRSSFERILPNLSSNEQFQLQRLLKE